MKNSTIDFFPFFTAWCSKEFPFPSLNWRSSSFALIILWISCKLSSLSNKLIRCRYFFRRLFEDKNFRNCSIDCFSFSMYWSILFPPFCSLKYWFQLKFSFGFLIWWRSSVISCLDFCFLDFKIRFLHQKQSAWDLQLALCDVFMLLHSNHHFKRVLLYFVMNLVFQLRPLLCYFHEQLVLLVKRVFQETVFNVVLLFFVAACVHQSLVETLLF